MMEYLVVTSTQKKGEMQKTSKIGAGNGSYAPSVVVLGEIIDGFKLRASNASGNFRMSFLNRNHRFFIVEFTRI